MEVAAPNPGSSEAVAQVCTCPVFDNHHGLGWRGGWPASDGETLFVYRASCPIHGARIQQMAEAL